jgi:drug/metabolite transporter (DMT)-like permease
MKMSLWAIVGIFVAGLAFWIVTSTATIPERPLPLLILALVFGVSPLGGFWMMYMAIRYENRPLPYILLAFIPYFFLGYYFERVRGKNLEATHRMRGTWGTHEGEGTKARER